MNYNYLANYGKPPEHETTGPLTDEARKGRLLKLGGALAVFVALGALLYYFFYGPTPLELKARKYSVPERQFTDQNARLDLPAGWTMLQRDNPFFHNVVSGQMFAIHPKSGCTAVLLIWPNTGATIDYQFAKIKEQFFVDWDKAVERDRQSIVLGGHDALRSTFDLWRHNAIREIAFVTSVRDELRYYLLLGYTPLEEGNASLPAFKELEQGFQLGPVANAPVLTETPPAFEEVKPLEQKDR
ncbi:MAG: hypothetical protein QOF02_1393 [Blastocatellia bacterium]|jgi:hypothetical protein|nr:hypothetical protein [Blastocatellia bacterium]